MSLKIINGAISYGAETIIEEINFYLNNTDKVAIVGRNGAGKTTFLKAIIDNEMLEEGIGEEKFNIIKEGTKYIGYLKQIEFENPNNTLLDEILKVYKDIIDLEDRIHKYENDLKLSSDESTIKKYTEALEEYKLKDGYTYKKEYQTALKKLGFSSEDENKKITEFSGGQRTKLALLKLILSKPDILLLDEPTNHMDIESIKWLEKYLKNYSKSIVIVSHDRMFLNNIVNKIYEIEYASMVEYKGDYEDFEKQKRENYEKRLKDYEFQQKEIKRLKAVADRFRYKPTKAKMALSKLKAIERMNIIQMPSKYDLKTFHTNFNIKFESGNQVLSVKNLEFGYDKSLGKLNFNLYRGQKLAIIGENGTGKSTLVKTLMGYINSISGEFTFGYNVEKQYFDQQLEFKNSEDTILEEFSNEFPNFTTTELRQSLGAFLFSGEDVNKQIKQLSGGEKVRLKLCEMFKKQGNLLILDEPTNHMDILGKENLENILKEYKGTLIFISHDRYFVNKIADSILAFENGKITYYDKTYKEYEEYVDGSEEIIIKEDNEFVKKDTSNKANYLAMKEATARKNKSKRLETEIEELEDVIRRLKAEMQDETISSDYKKLQEISDKIDNTSKIIENKMEEWESIQD